MRAPAVALVVGSPSDLPAAKAAEEVLGELGLACEVRVLSAHRTPGEARAFAATARERGLRVLIAGAGLAAHLAGALASETLLPVIGVPLAGGSLGGLDSLLATVQMPRGVPVATVGIGETGMANAAVLAAEILALSDAGLAERLAAWRAARTRAVLEADEQARRSRGGKPA